jgi:hypothetical protein
MLVVLVAAQIHHDGNMVCLVQFKLDQLPFCDSESMTEEQDHVLLLCCCIQVIFRQPMITTPMANDSVHREWIENDANNFLMSIYPP